MKYVPGSLVPVFPSICDRADRMLAMVANLLDIKRRTGHQFREESVTDLLLATIAQLPAWQVEILRPTEWRYGSDFDLHIVDPVTADTVHYRIQAKRLSDHRTDWQKGRYVCLDHHVGKTKTLQADILCTNIPPGCVPLYAFYNHESVATRAADVEGIDMADAHAVRLAAQRAAAGEADYRKIGKLAPLFFPFRTLVCPPSGGAPAPVATPADSLAAVRAAILARPAAWTTARDTDTQPTFDDAKPADAERGEGRARPTPPRPDIDIRENLLTFYDARDPTDQVVDIARFGLAGDPAAPFALLVPEDNAILRPRVILRTRPFDGKRVAPPPAPILLDFPRVRNARRDRRMT